MFYASVFRVWKVGQMLEIQVDCRAIKRKCCSQTSVRRSTTGFAKTSVNPKYIYPEFIQSKNAQSQVTLLLTLVMFNRNEHRINHWQKYELTRRANTGAWQREKSKASNSKRGRGPLSNQLPWKLMAPLRRSGARCNHTTPRKHPLLSSCFLHLRDFSA